MNGKNGVFERLSLRKRGQFSNYFTLFPVKKIELSDDSVILQKGRKIFKYDWKEILEAKIIYSKSGKNNGVGLNTRLFVLKTADETFKFDVSGQFPDFKPAKELLEKLEKHLQINEVSVIKEKEIPYWSKYRYSICAVFFGILVLAKEHIISDVAGIVLTVTVLIISSLNSKK